MVIAIGGVAVWTLDAQQPASTSLSVGSVSFMPTVIAVNTSTAVTITIPIPDPTLISGSVNLVRYDTGTPTIIGALNDNGQNGDAVVKDQIYTIRTSFGATSTTNIELRVSAAFRGRLQRYISPQFQIAVTQNGSRPLPPDPGQAGMQTLNGIDSDGDGVRDDVERWIYLQYPSSQRTQFALTQLAKTYLDGVSDSDIPQLGLPDIFEAFYAQECLAAVRPNDFLSIAEQLQALVLNTPARISADEAEESNSGNTLFYTSPPTNQFQSRCSFNPSSLPN